MESKGYRIERLGSPSSDSSERRVPFCLHKPATDWLLKASQAATEGLKLIKAPQLSEQNAPNEHHCGRRLLRLDCFLLPILARLAETAPLGCSTIRQDSRGVPIPQSHGDFAAMGRFQGLSTPSRSGVWIPSTRHSFTAPIPV